MALRMSERLLWAMIFFTGDRWVLGLSFRIVHRSTAFPKYSRGTGAMRMEPNDSMTIYVFDGTCRRHCAGQYAMHDPNITIALGDLLHVIGLCS